MRIYHLRTIPGRLCIIALVLSGVALAGVRQAAADGSDAFSANGLFLAGYTKLEDPDGAPTSRTGLFTQQVEFHVAADIDSNLRAVVTVDLPRGSRTVDRVDIGETYMTADLSSTWQVRAGRFLVDFGRQNHAHAHEQPFLDPPLVLERLFGPDGIQEVGVGLRRSVPLPWNADLSLQITNGDNPRWVNPTDEDLLYVLHSRHAWNPSPSVSVELGGSWAGGRNPTERWTHALGADITVESTDARWQTEYIRVAEDLKSERRTTGGLTSFLQYRVANRWWTQVRYDYYGLPIDQGWEDRATALLAFVPHERTSVRFQYSRWRVDARHRGFNQYHIQLRFGVGPHGSSLCHGCQA